MISGSMVAARPAGLCWIVPSVRSVKTRQEMAAA
jgi:hypothetical protein